MTSPTFRNEKQYHGKPITNAVVAQGAVAAAPTAAEFNALRTDLVNAVTKLNEVLAVLRNAGSI